jgi:hypothetical protein
MGSRLVSMHVRGGHEYFLVPGGKVTDEIASQIKVHPRVIAQKDGLFPGHDQTWVMQTFAADPAIRQFAEDRPEKRP